MGGFKFKRPVGTGADVNELEYVSALLQTEVRDVRMDCSLKPHDIALFLRSRHGINISSEQVEQSLVRGGFGTDDTLDLMELVALLLIPNICVSKDDDLLASIVIMLREDALGLAVDDKNPIELTKEVMRKIFVSLGEEDLSRRDELLENMVRAASDGSSDPTMLSTAAFSRAVTHDLGAYQPTNASKTSTQCSDCLGDVSHSDVEKFKHDGIQIALEATAPHLDLTADTVRSRSLVIATWASFVLSFFTYYSGIGTFAVLPECEVFDFRGTFFENFGPFMCTIGWSVGRWLYTVIVMSIYGLAYFGSTNIGNGIETNNPFLPLAGAIAAAIFTFIPPWMPIFLRSEAVVDVTLKGLSMLLGSCVILINLWEALAMACFLSSPRFVPNGIRTEAFVKQAAVKKTGRMVDNARALHGRKDPKSAVQSGLGQALLNHAKYGNSEVEEVGGYRWAWKKIWSLEIFSDEGMWFPNRLISISITQFVMAIFILLIGSAGTFMVVDNYAPPDTSFEVVLKQLFDIDVDLDQVIEITQTVSATVANFIVEDVPFESFGCPTVDEPVDCSGFPSFADCVAARGTSWLCTVVDYTDQNGPDASSATQEGLLRGAGLDIPQIYDTSLNNLFQSGESAVNSLYPSEKYMIFAPLIAGTIVAFATAFAIALATIPSIATTTLKLRSGVIKYLHEPRIFGLRKAPDQVATLQGTMFWSILFSSGLMGIVVALPLFLLLWQSTSSVAQFVVANLIGLILVVLLQVVTAKLCRILTTQVYYRKRPRTANIILLTRECAYFALTIFSALIRVGKLIGTTILFVGRMDIPFLAPGVAEIEYLGLYLDNHPQIFLMDILQHEAHRHPYIETLGAMCLLKLKHGDTFANKVGSTWRLLLVLMLMPWLTKYRTLARPMIRSQDEGIVYGDYNSAGMDESEEENSKTQREMRGLKRQVLKLKEQLLISQASQKNIKTVSEKI